MENLDENAINIFTDGSSYSHPRRGGMGLRFITVDDAGDEVVYDYQPLGVRSATNQQMELMACIEALNVLRSKGSPISLARFRKVVIYTDSMYVVDHVDTAKFTWPRAKWHTRDG